MYGKHFISMYSGSMIGAGLNVFAVWGYIISNTVKGRVELNPKLLAMILGCQEIEVQSAIDYLCTPDTHSRSKVEDGKRLIKEGQFQYFVPTHEAYRKILNEDERREYNRIKQTESRARKSVKEDVIDSQSLSSVSAHTEAEAEAEKKEQVLLPNGNECTLAFDAFVDAWNQVAEFADLPKVRDKTQKRKNTFKTRYRNKSWREFYEDALVALQNTPFLTGKNKSGWKADLTWFMKPDSVTLILEGKYGQPQEQVQEKELDPEFIAEMEYDEHLAGRRANISPEEIERIRNKRAAANV